MLVGLFFCFFYASVHMSMCTFVALFMNRLLCVLSLSDVGFYSFWLTDWLIDWLIDWSVILLFAIFQTPWHTFSCKKSYQSHVLVWLGVIPNQTPHCCSCLCLLLCAFFVCRQGSRSSTGSLIATSAITAGSSFTSTGRKFAWKVIAAVTAEADHRLRQQQQ